MNDSRLPVHMWLGFSVTAVTIVLAVWRGRLYWAERPPGVAYLLAAALAVGALVIQAELGGQMSFGSMETPTEMSHESKGNSHDSTPHGSGSPVPGSQPATRPDSHEHQHAIPSGTLQWRDHIDLNS